MTLSTIIRWLVTIRCGINFLLGDLVSNTISKSNLRVPGLLLFVIIVPGMRFLFIRPVCRARRADHLSAEILEVIVVLRRRSPRLKISIGLDR